MKRTENTAHYKQSVLDSIRILVIEDNAVDRELIKSHLEYLGLTNIQMAVDGTEGLFKVNNADKAGSPFQLIITDWKMPKKDGLTVLTSLKSKHSYARQYTIMVTSVAEEDNVIAALGAGVDNYILKPIDPTVFTKKIYDIVDRIQKGRAA